VKDLEEIETLLLSKGFSIQVKQKREGGEAKLVIVYIMQRPM
jgi:hypothetical protein